MRVVFGVLSLLIVVAIVGVLAKKQLGALSGSSTAPPVTASGVTAPVGTPKQQGDEVKQSVESVMQQARPMPEDEKK